MTLSTIPNLTVERAVEYIAKYREDHRILAVARFGSPGQSYCAHDGIDLIKVKGGWRHNPSLIHDLSREAGPVPAGKCRTCKRTFAAHLRLAELYRILAASGNPAVRYGRFASYVDDSNLKDAPIAGYTLHDFVA